MSDLIRRDELLDLYKVKEEYKDYSVPLPVIIQNIKDMPAVDAVEVVRCKDCDFQREPGPFALNDIYCNLHRTYFPNHGFCHSGERREGNE